jgi:hypothetical protein
MFLFSIIGIVLLYFAYAYLKGLKTCKCVNDTYATRLKNLEAIMLGLNVIILCFAILSYFHLFNALDKIKQSILKIIALGGITMVIYHAFFLYNGYNFWNTLPKKCECADKWEKYYVYFQTIISFLIILITTLFVGVLAFKKVQTSAVNETSLNRYIPEVKSSSKRRKSSKRK